MSKIDKKLVSLSKKLEIPSNIIRNVAKVEVISNDFINIENHKGILRYDDIEIDINCGDYILKIVGFNLELSAISFDDIAIYGDIKSLDFIK